MTTPDGFVQGYDELEARVATLEGIISQLQNDLGLVMNHTHDVSPPIFVLEEESANFLDAFGVGPYGDEPYNGE